METSYDKETDPKKTMDIFSHNHSRVSGGDIERESAFDAPVCVGGWKISLFF